MSDRIPLSRPAIGPAEEELVLEVLRSGRLSLGPGLTRFESALGAFLGVEHVSAVSSGTAGLHLAIRAAGVAAGDEVVTSPLSFVASANCLLYEDAKPVFGPASRSLPKLPLGVEVGSDGRQYFVARNDFPEAIGPAFWERP